ncbi:ABC transporter permease [Streptomyces sp. NPDC126514]|uniref:ABC transporter permease n=1 Tax=Streptomyces sp. NPDC126514 TaxID=3155210 RepID=UPI00331A5B07
MVRFTIRRILASLIVLWAVTLIVFIATHALPGDPARAILGREATSGQLAALRRRLGTDQPLSDQYVTWLTDTIRLDLGSSLSNQLPVETFLASRIYGSLMIMLVAIVVSTPLAIFLGGWSAWRRDRFADHSIALATLILAALPEFVIGIALVMVFATGWLHVFPAVYVEPEFSLKSGVAQLLLPVATLVLVVVPYISRMMRGTMVSVLESEYVQYARLKGLPELTVLRRHVIPNAIAPVVQVIAIQIGYLLGGVVVVEYIFNYPGIGSALVDAVGNRDLPVIQALTLLVSVTCILVNLLADLLSASTQPQAIERRR